MDKADEDEDVLVVEALETMTDRHKIQKTNNEPNFIGVNPLTLQFLFSNIISTGNQPLFFFFENSRYDLSLLLMVNTRLQILLNLEYDTLTLKPYI